MAKTAVLSVRVLGDAVGGIKALRDTGTASDGLLGKLGKISPGVVAVGGAFIAAGGVAAKALYDIGATWDNVSDTIRVGTGATGAALDDMVTQAKNIASTIPAAIDDIGPVVADLNTRLGLTGDTLRKVGSQYLEAGRILGEAVNVEKTSQAFAQFKIQGEAVVGGMDDLFRVSQATGVSINDLAGTIAKGGPTLTNLGFSFAESAALAGSLNKAGLNADTTLAALQKGMVTLAKAGEQPQTAFRRVVGEIDGFVKAGDTAAALKLSSQIFGTRGAAQFISAVQSGAIGVENLMVSAGTTSDTILGLGAETADAAEKWQILKNKAMVALEPIGSAVFGLAGDALGGLVEVFNGIDLTPAADAIKVAGDALSGLGPILSGITDFITKLAPLFNVAFESIAAIVKPALAIIGDIISTATALISGDWSAAWTGVKNIAKGAWDFITGLVRRGIDGVVNFLRRLDLGRVFSDMWTHASNAVGDGTNRLMEWVLGLPTRIFDALGSVGDGLATIGHNMMVGLLDGITGMAQRIVDSVGEVINNAVGWAKNLLGIHSPSRVFATIGTQTGQGLVDGLVGQTRAVGRASAAMVNAAIPDGPLNIPLTTTRTSRGASSAGAGGITITINGALDPLAVARQIRDVLTYDARVRGLVSLNEAAA